MSLQACEFPPSFASWLPRMSATVGHLLPHVRQHSHSDVCMRFDPVLARLFFWITLLLYNTDAQLGGEAAWRRVCMGTSDSYSGSMCVFDVIERRVLSERSL